MEPAGAQPPASGSVPTAHPFSADRPIASKSEDLLGRAAFAQNLARAIEGWKQKDSLVMALYGPWGTGKTSLKNLVVDELGGRVGVIDFDPWQWSAQEGVGEAFFEQLARGIAQRPGVGLRSRWRARSLAFWIRHYARLLNLAASGLGLAGRIGSLLAALFVPGLRRGPARAKVKVAELLRRLEHPTLVVVDDVDRLTRAEIRLVFQLVKANADFPNLVYLLLFDRQVVEAALEDQGMPGRDYLEKVVQVGLDVPQPERARIDAVLFRELDELLRLPGMRDRWDQQRWARLFLDGIQPLVQTLRHVRRFGAMLSFQVSLLRHGDTLEVNPIDLIGVEVLRIFTPRVHSALPGAKRALTERSRPVSSAVLGSRDPEIESRRSAIRSLVELAEEPARPAVEAVIKELFPTAQWASGGPTYMMEEEWVRELRICVPDFFDRYFLLSVPERDIAQSEIDALLAATADRDALAARLQALQGRGLLDIALQRLMAYRGMLDPAHAVPFTTALFDLGDDLPHEADGFIALSPLDHAHVLIRDLLGRLPDQQARAEVVSRAVQDSHGLSLPVLLVARAEARASSPDGRPPLFAPEDLQGLVEVCLERIREAAKSGRLEGHPMLLALVHQWERWARGEARRWVVDLIRSREGLLAFLRGSMTRIRSVTAGEYLPRHRYEIRLEEIEPFVAIEELSRAVGGLPREELGPEDRRAVEAWHRALQAREAGEAEDEWPDE